MIILYNILQLILLPVLLPPLILLVVMVPKYRRRTPHRLGFGLQKKDGSKGKKTVWIHATSVGEVTSALPLVSGLRQELPDVTLIFSASSEAGARMAKKLLQTQVDQFIAFPFDILPVINRFLRLVQPDLFILVETDFWPNIVARLKRLQIPSLLVNGRISEKSMRSYRRFPFFFSPLFSCFHTLSMQTESDRQNLITLGVEPKKIKTLGNLKYDTALYSDSARNQSLSFGLPEYQQLLVAGSTHEGEEEIILESYRRLKKVFPHLYLVIAPRNIKQGKAIKALAATMNLEANCRSQINAGGKDLFILDSLGELNRIYSHADLAFVGGSLVEKGGHNPIEPAIFSIPVLYGPHMEDFSEISSELLKAKGAIMVRDQNGLSANLRALLQDEALQQKTGDAARTCIEKQQGVIKRHIELIRTML